MPPHCDSLDGPVVVAARAALDAGDVELILPYAPAAGESEIRDSFAKVIAIRSGGGAAAEIADRWFFETVVRVHRAGEGAPFTGLKPAGLDVGPVIPVAERAIESGSPDELVAVLTTIVAEQARQRFEHLMKLREHAGGPVADAREYVSAMLGLQVWSHKLYLSAAGGAHEHHG